jgi:hypothetical protein
VPFTDPTGRNAVDAINSGLLPFAVQKEMNVRSIKQQILCQRILPPAGSPAPAASSSGDAEFAEAARDRRRGLFRPTTSPSAVSVGHEFQGLEQLYQGPWFPDGNRSPRRSNLRRA